MTEQAEMSHGRQTGKKQNRFNKQQRRKGRRSDREERITCGNLVKKKTQKWLIRGFRVRIRGQSLDPSFSFNIRGGRVGESDPLQGSRRKFLGEGKVVFVFCEKNTN